jgi:hypothetical protein
MPRKPPAAPKRRLTSNAELIRAQNPADARVKDALIEQLFKAPIPREELQHNLFLFQDRRIISRLLFIHELYQHVLAVHGNILEFGVRYGANLALFTSFRGIYEPFNHNRKIIGFDTFSGFAGVNAGKDAKEASAGSFAVTEQYEVFLQGMLALHESMAPVEAIRKFELVKGDASRKIRPYLQAHPETVVALAYFDFDIYQPTKACLSAIVPYLARGAVIAFDELNDPQWPGETAAFREVLGSGRARLRHSMYRANAAYLIFE